MSQRLHFIAIGGAAMHNLAIALKHKGYQITGSDDEIMEPSRTRLNAEGLLPEADGWFPEKISSNLDGVILGMHARADNPELLRAKELGIPVYSFPEFLYEHSKEKVRVVVGGSHGKTTITAMIMHSLKSAGVDFDYMVGAKVEGFDTMVHLSDAPVIILEGDEYLSSPIDRRPKFHLYQPTIALMSGIAWDHINVFPTFDNYLEQFRIYADIVPATGTMIYFQGDPHVKAIAETSASQSSKIPYNIPEHQIRNGITYIKAGSKEYPVSVFGEHNLANMEGAKLVCRMLGVSEENFYESIASFKGAARRLELVAKNETTALYRDFAHSPSKLKATINAVRKQFPDRKLIACIELHTFSSLNKSFLNQYAGTMDEADEKIVFYNQHTIEHKKLNPITHQDVKTAFRNGSIRVYTDSRMLKDFLFSIDTNQSVFLLMSSGTFDQLDLKELSDRLTGSEKVTD
jgi:UDP-N-acetylmuramate: L-alanyl-gamma-D-glutamyl-meso-diaminopimelate ligase